MSIFSKILGDPNQKVLDKFQPLVDKINQLEPRFEKFSNEDFKNKTQEFKERLKKGETLDNLLPEAFAVVREVAKRTLGQRAFDSQLIGGIVLHHGQIAEMKTGEGKTLAATFPVYLNALTGKGVHVITVNDYLARRDTVWMGQIYNLLGLSVGCINHESAFLYDESLERENHKSQITNPKQIQNSNDQNSKHENFDKDKTRDEVGGFKVVDEFLRPVNRKEAYATDIIYGTNNEFGFDYLRDNMAQSKDQQAQRELNYAIIDEVDSILIDEARTPLIISAPAEESTDKYYQFAKLVAPMKEQDPSTSSGQGDYNLDEKMRAATFTETGQDKIVQQLGFDPWVKNDVTTSHQLEAALKAKTLFQREKDYIVKGGEVIIVDEFTGRLMPGRRYSEGLHQAIEAKEGTQIQRESRTLATITFQNYFRLYNKLAGMTGTAATEAEEFSKIYKLEVVIIPTNKPLTRQDLADVIYKNEKGKFQAIVKKIKELHETGQPVLVGTISIEKNELLSELLERTGVPHQILNAKQHEKEAEIIAQAGRSGAVTIATNMAGRGVDIVLGGNPATAEEANKVKQAGGLYVIGTERHESRRIDNQLRGRSGRQGDAGASQFYISMEDDLMRVFGSDRMKSIMERLGVPDDMPIANTMISKSIAAAQRKVEGHNFDIRKHLVEYDDVINKHRETIYRKRKEILELADLGAVKNKILELVSEEISQVVLFHTQGQDESSWNLKEIYEVINTIFPIREETRLAIKDLPILTAKQSTDESTSDKLISYLNNLADQFYDELITKLTQQAPEEKFVILVMRGLLLRAIDVFWIEHLEAMDHMRAGIGLRGYGQQDPLVEYKKEAYRMFNELMASIQKQVVYSVFKIGLAVDQARDIEKRSIQFTAPSKTAVSEKSAIAQMAERDSEKRQSTDNIKIKPRDADGQKIGRNDPCPCGSGKKYKKCCGA